MMKKEKKIEYLVAKTTHIKILRKTNRFLLQKIEARFKSDTSVAYLPYIEIFFRCLFLKNMTDLLFFYIKKIGRMLIQTPF